MIKKLSTLVAGFSIHMLDRMHFTQKGTADDVFSPIEVGSPNVPQDDGM